EVLDAEVVQREVGRVPAREVAAAATQVAEVARCDIAPRREHVGLRNVLGEVVEVVPAVVLLGVLGLDVEQGEQDPLHFHGGQPTPITILASEMRAFRCLCDAKTLRMRGCALRGVWSTGHPSPSWSKSCRTWCPNRGRWWCTSRRLLSTIPTSSSSRTST